MPRPCHNTANNMGNYYRKHFAYHTRRFRSLISLVFPKIFSRFSPSSLPLSPLFFLCLLLLLFGWNFQKFPLNMFMFLCVQLRHVSLVSRSNCRSFSLSPTPSLSLSPIPSLFCKILCLFCNCHLAFFCPLHRTNYVCFHLSLSLSLLHVKLATSFGVYWQRQQANNAQRTG